MAASPASQAALDEGQALFNAKSYAEAADKFEAAVAADPGYALAWYSLARVRRKMNQCTGAIAAYRRYIALEPDKSEPYYGLGLCLRETGDRPGAIEALKRYVALEKDSTSAWVGNARDNLKEMGAGAGPVAATPPANPPAASAPSGAGAKPAAGAAPTGNVSRLTAGRLALRLERVELGELLRDLVGRLRDQADEVGSTIELTIAAPDETDETIWGAWDRGRLEQLVTNLLSNAIKYGLGKPIAVSAEVVSQRVRVRVRDAGLGIPRADQSRIFQAFERLPTAERVGGLGLGLYIGRQIAMAHGGTLAVDSAAGAGATFTLELPLEATAAAAKEPPAP